MKLWQLSANFNLQLVVILSGCLSALTIQPGLAEETSNPLSSSTRKAEASKAMVSEDKGFQIPQLRDIKFPATSAQMLVQQPAPTNATPVEIVAITGVKANPTEKGVEIILETSQGDKLQVANRSTGNNFSADITGGQLRLPSGDAFTFKSEKPISGITQITVTNIDTNTVRVTVAGEKVLPAVELFDDNAGLIFTVASTPTTAQQPEKAPSSEKPATEKPEEQLFSQQDDPIELMVTGERDSYSVQDTLVGTKTDTPLRDIPQSIQVVPRQVLQDRQVRSITEALENVSGVTSISNAAGSRDYFTIRGFETYGALLNGIPSGIVNDGSFVNVERLEVLKGPSSVLYGETLFSGLGGVPNFVTKRPLRDPFYEISATVGSFNSYQGTIDFSGPLNNAKTALYRFNVGYQSSDTFLAFNEIKRFSVAPSLSFNMGRNTDLVIEGDVNFFERIGQQPDGQPAVGTVLPNPNGKISRSFAPNGPSSETLVVNGRVGYSLEHRFNENLKLRNAFLYEFSHFDSKGKPYFLPDSLAEDNRTLNRVGVVTDLSVDFYYLDTNLLGKFNTGSISHQLLAGVSLSRNTLNRLSEEGVPAAPVDVFDRIFDNTDFSTGVPTNDSSTTRDTLGIYIQDQITLADNLKLLLGGRMDLFEERTVDRLATVETSQSDTAFSPRVGIVYQPIQPISLYASFARSFAPTIGTSATGAILKPERGTQYEVGIKADITSKLSTTLAFYDLTRTNVTTIDPENPGFSIQTGKQRSRGIELDISGEILPGWNIITGYAYTDAKVVEDNDIPVGNRLFSAPKHSFNLWTTYRIQKGGLQGVGFGLGFYYAGERPADLGNTLELPSYFRTDAAIFYEREQFRAAVNFRNLFNIEYYQPFGSGKFVNPGDPFTVQGTVSWRF